MAHTKRMINDTQILKSRLTREGRAVYTFHINYITTPNSKGEFYEGFYTVQANGFDHAKEIFLTTHSGVVIISIKRRVIK